MVKIRDEAAIINYKLLPQHLPGDNGQCLKDSGYIRPQYNW